MKLEIRERAVENLKQLDEKTNNGLEIRSRNSETAFLKKHVWYK
jgi:hypothetical protein